jgi:HSP20 family protein
MAGADSSNIEVYIHNDLLTIRGIRPKPMEESLETSYLYQECYWGKFSRTVVLPVDVRGDDACAEYKNGVLTIVIPKKKNDSRISVTIVED